MASMGNELQRFTHAVHCCLPTPVACMQSWHAVHLWAMLKLVRVQQCAECAECRMVPDIIPKEKSSGLPVFTQALRLVPYTMPDHWSGPRLCEDLPGLCSSWSRDTDLPLYLAAQSMLSLLSVQRAAFSACMLVKSVQSL